ncbi:MAG: bifunctional ADP-dependent NAD(P)H-hydrate dehydratase/NAD(P)H-hydrate epimerase [Desulfuromonas sp.]|uniref:NAD(P)H-hydrate dehydratase n=1 Tax=Desulfuromonas sp. TaxID=892 RepID=UPI000CB47883|nr:NAD(P)H-hydrate dehydratase [Desulfuromonas sp.]PLX83619.1 MAG: bifunctional ADP-dependent NAD(P)H-hydrate dehydratase/NAD(P)H-hydrate epimerase [Desulfuromonas sp.]
MRLVTADQMRELDRRTIEEVGIPGVVLMENAGRGAAEHLCRRFASLKPGPVLVLAGKGNNGGDGYVIARHLLDRGWQVRTVVLASAESVGADAGVNLRALRNSGGDIDFAEDEGALRAALDKGRGDTLVVDALLGTGLTSEVRGAYALAIDWINDSGAQVLAVDIPSWLDGSTGCILGRAVRADSTVTFAFAKVGHAVFPGAGLCGELLTVDIGIPATVADGAGDALLLVESAEAAALLPPRPFSGHKGTFGHLLVVAGSTGKSGAAALTAEGGLRAGAGLVTLACPAGVHGVLETKLTEAMTAPLPEVDGAVSLQALQALRFHWAGKEAVALGPGLGQTEEVRDLVRRLVRECPLPLVVDADGINALAPDPSPLGERSGRPAVLTPHPGEMARLTGGTVAEVEADRLGVSRDFARQYGVVLVLKGARTVVAFPDGRVRINGSGNPGLASGGMGDVLTGVIGGLLAQGMKVEEAATLGVFLHGLAADRILSRMGDAGMLAGDLLAEIPAARKQLLIHGGKHAQS